MKTTKLCDVKKDYMYIACSPLTSHTTFHIHHIQPCWCELQHGNHCTSNSFLVRSLQHNSKQKRLLLQLSFIHSFIHSFGQLVGRAVHPSICLSVSQAISQSVSHQSVSQSSVIKSVLHSPSPVPLNKESGCKWG